MGQIIANQNETINQIILKHITDEEEKAFSNPESVLQRFKNELIENGFHIMNLNQAEGMISSHKKEMLPIAIKYYNLAVLSNEKTYLLKWFYYHGCEEAVSILLVEGSD